VNVRVAGGPPSIGETNDGDRLVLETPGNESIVFNPTGPDTGNIVIDADDNRIYTAASTDSIITFGPFTYVCDDPQREIVFTYVSSPGGVELVEYDGEGSLGFDVVNIITINGTEGDDTTTVSPREIGNGMFVSDFSPLFIFRSFQVLTVNGGAGGFDHVIYNATEGPDVITSTATLILTATSVPLAINTLTLGAGIDRLNVNTFAGNDIIDLDLTDPNLQKSIDAGAGNDSVNLSGSVDADVFGGDGNDLLVGSPDRDFIDGGDGDDAIFSIGGADWLEAGDGDDLIVGGPGDDFAFGGAGSDTFVWNPGDGDDLFEGDEGDDTLAFAGDNGTDTYVISGDNGRVLFQRQPGNVGINMGGVENIFANSETVELSGRKEVPSNTSTSGGFANFTFDPLTGLFNVRVFVIGLAAGDIVDSHIHMNIAGSNGPVVVPLGGGGGYVAVGGGLERAVVGLSLADIVAPAGFSAMETLLEILLGRAYFNVHTPAFPGGEIRGNIIVSGLTAGSGGGDSLTVRDTTGTALRSIVFDAGNEAEIRNGAALIDTVTVEGLNTADHVVAGVPNVLDNNYLVSGLPYNILVTSSDGAVANGVLRDQFVLNGNGGDDNLKGLPPLESVTRVRLDGGAGNDFLSADAILIGGPGNDVLEGGAGDDQMDGGPGDDTFVGNGGTDAINGGADPSVGDTILLSGTAGSDAFTLTLNALGHLLATINGLTTTYTNSMGGPIASSGVEQILVEGKAGNDTLTVDSTNGAIPILVNYNGGANNDVLTLRGGTATADTYSVGPNPEQGRSVIVIGGVTQTVSFENIEPVFDLVAGPLVVEATPEHNAINYTQGSVAANGRVTIDNYEFIEFSNKTTLTINAHEGSDDINLNNKSTPTGLLSITVNGGDPTASDRVIVNGTTGPNPIVVDQFDIDGARVVGAQPVTVIVDAAEHLIINGQGGDDTLTVITPAGEHEIEYLPGTQEDSGSIAITSTTTGPVQRIVPLSFQDLGSGGSLTFADVGGSRVDDLAVQGTNHDDTFRVTAAGEVRVDKSNLLLTTLLMNTPGVDSLRLLGLDGDDSFSIPGNHPFSDTLRGPIRIEAGNPSASDVVNFSGSGANPVAVNLADQSVSEATFGAVFLSGVEILNVTANNALSIAATDSDDDVTVTVSSATSGKIKVGYAVQQNGQVAQAVAAPLINYSNLPASPANAVAFDLAGGEDTLVVVGNALAQIWDVNAAAGTVAIDDLNNNPGVPDNNDGRMSFIRTESLAVFGLEGNDAFNVTAGAIPVFVDGGDPIGTTPGDSINPIGAIGFFPGPEPDEGGFLTPGGTISFDHIEEIGTVIPVPGCPFLIVGTNADDDITVIARDGSTHAGANGVQDFTFSVNASGNILVLNQPDLFIDALNGDDDIVIRAPAPNDAAWDVNVRVAGGPPSIGEINDGDRLVLETPGFDRIVFNPTGPDTGTIVIDEDGDGVYTQDPTPPFTDSIITFGPFVFVCPPMSPATVPFTYVSSPGGIELIEYDGELAGAQPGSATDDISINGTALNDITTVTPMGVGPGGSGQGSFVSPFSPRFNFRGFDALSVSGGAGGFDHVIYNATEGADAITSDADSILLAGTSVTLRPGIDQLNLNAFDGNDNIDLDLAVLGLKKVVDAGAGNDIVDLSGVAVDPADPVFFGGIGDDTLIGSPNDDLMFAGAGNDVLLGLGGSDQEYGEAGNDRFGDLAAGDGNPDDAGSDFFFGGDGSDTAVWDPGDGDDFFDGGDGADIQIFNGAFLNGSPEIINVFADLTDPSRARIFRNLGSIDIIMSAVEQVDINVGETLFGLDTVVIGRANDGDAGATPAPTSPYTDPTASLSDLSTTDVAIVNVNVAGGEGENVFVDGRPLDDNMLVSLESAATGVVRVAGLPYDVRVHNASVDDRLTIRGNEGNDAIKVVNPTGGGALNVESVISITLAGGAGNDSLSADAILIGGIGNDFLEGGAGPDLFFGNEGEDTMIGHGGVDTYDGGPDFDTILIPGTSGNDRIDARQDSATQLRYEVGNHANGFDGVLGGAGTETDVLVVNLVTGERTVERARIEAGDGDDIIRVSWADGLGQSSVLDSLRFDVAGGTDFTRDRLAVVDEGTGDLVLYRKGELDSTGSMTVGPAEDEPLEAVFQGIEYAEPVLGSGGQTVVFKHDPFEFNNSQFLATHLGANQAINVDPTIDPGPDGPFGLPGDSDFYRVEAQVTGTLDFQVFFEEVPTVPSGRLGLPGNGNLNIELFDRDGLPVAIAGAGPTFGGNDGAGVNPELNLDGEPFQEDERIRISAVQGQVYYLRVFGVGAAINNYTMTISNVAAPTPYDIELDDFPPIVPASPGDACAAIRPPSNALSNNSDTGRSQFDNVTCDATPRIRFRLDDAIFLHDLPGNPAADSPPDEVIPIPFNAAQTRDTTVPGFRVAIFDEGTPQQTGQLPQVPIGYARQIAEGVYEFDFGSDAINLAAPNGPTTSFVLSDGSHFLSARVQMVDPAIPTATGFGSRSVSLEIVVDTVVPPVAFGDLNVPDDGLDPASDSGIVGQPFTHSDEITNDTTPSFFGAAEANTVIRVWLDRDGDGVVDLPDNDGVLEAGEDVQLGETVAVPLDGTNQFPNGLWTLTSTVDLNNPQLNLPEDGRRLLLVTAEDLAGNISSPASLEIFLDTRGPQVTNVQSINIADGGLFPILDPKPLGDHGPTPLTRSIRIDFQDLPARVLQSLTVPGGNGPFGFQHEALNRQLAEELGNYRLVGDQNGFIEIEDADFTSIGSSLIPPSPFARGFVTLRFGTPLPDDRYTLTIFDRIKDDAGNALDGESNVIAATENPDLPSGDEDPGQSFEARFTIDSRPEIGTFCCGSWYIDLNGNGSFDDPNNHDTDAINGDIVFKFGLPGDFPVVGDWDGNGFDEIGVYGRRSDGFRFELDLNGNGAFDSDDASFLFGNGGRPVAGDWDGVGEDHVAVFNGTQWFKDDTNAAYTSSTSFVPATVINTSARGRPIAADFNADGDDDVGLFQNNVFVLDFTSDDNFQVDTSITFGFNTIHQLPVADDWDADGDGNIGLFVTDRNGQFPREAAEWYLDLGPPNRQPVFGGNPSPGDGLFQPPPTGFPSEPLVFQDYFYQFGDELSEPVVGNFDPPRGAATQSSIPVQRPLVRLDDAATRTAAATPIYVWEQGGTGQDSASIATSRDVDVFQFTPTDSGRVAIDVQSGGSTLNPNLAVYGTSKKVFARNDNYGGTTDSHVEMNVVAGQTYYIQITGSKRTTGNYDLLVDYLLVTDSAQLSGNTPPAGQTPPSTEPNPGEAHFDVGSQGARTEGRIQHAGEIDTFVFTPSVGGQLEIRTAAKRLDTVLEVLDSAGTLLSHNDNASSATRNSRVVVDVVAGQSYTIRIRSATSKLGDYLVGLDYLLAGGV
jgi:Ca2+-binding RTX toxin-like protein